MSGMSKVVNLKVKNNLLNLDATEIAELIKNGQVTSEEVTKTFIDHIKNVNPTLNAVVEDRFVEALEEAKQMDLAINEIDLEHKPLYGVPISIKESLNVKGMKTTGGIVHRKDLIMSTDADVVHLVKE